MSPLAREPLDRLVELLRIPTISADPQYREHTRKGAEYVAGMLRDAGLDHVRLIERASSHPLVAADSLHAPGKPTLLLYAHYDVQPPEPLEEWISPPFEPSIRDGNIYARGASDDKGQLVILLAALKRLRGRLPVNVRVLIEGEEESGGEHIAEYLAAHREEWRSDAALIADTEMFAPGLPSLCVGLRGIVYGELHVEGARQDLHSGVYGGAAPNPLEAIAHILCAWKDRDGRLTIPGIDDDVRPPSALEREAWSRLPFDEEVYRQQEVGSPSLVGEPGYGVLERVWARPSLTVHGIRGGYVGEGAKTVIPARAAAKISLRLVPDQQPERVVEQIRSAVENDCPAGVTARFELLHAAPASRVDPSDRFLQAAAAALTETFGTPTVFTRSGGSIPIVGLLAEHLGVPSVLMGFGLPDDNIHSPNEKLSLDNFERGIAATVRFLERAGAL